MHVQTRLGARWRRRHRDRAWHAEHPAGGVFRNLAVAGVGQEGIALDETTKIEIRVRIRLDGDAVALDASLASISEGRRVGPARSSTCRSRGAPAPQTTNKDTYTK